MMYNTFKYSHGKEKYTEILPEHFKKVLFQFRMGTHKLPVNNSKHFNVPHMTDGDIFSLLFWTSTKLLVIRFDPVMP